MFLSRLSLQRQQEQRGASLMEMLFAIAITALVVPFAYRQITDVGTNLRTLGIAKQLVENAIPVRNHIRLFAAEFPEDQLIEVETDDEFERIYVYNADGSIAAFVVTKAFRDDILTAHRIANLIGMDAAVVDAQFISLEDMVVHNSGKKIVCRANCMKIACKMQVYIFHRDNLRISAACRPAFNSKNRP